MLGQNVLLELSPSDRVQVYAYTASGITDHKASRYTQFIGLLLRPSVDAMHEIVKRLGSPGGDEDLEGNDNSAAEDFSRRSSVGPSARSNLNGDAGGKRGKGGSDKSMSSSKAGKGSSKGRSGSRSKSKGSFSRSGSKSKGRSRSHSASERRACHRGRARNNRLRKYVVQLDRKVDTYFRSREADMDSTDMILQWPHHKPGAKP